MRNRLLYTADRVHAMFARMRSELEEQHSRHLYEYASLRRELDALRAAYEALRGAVLDREKAEAGLALLQRDRERLEGRATWLH
jgi:hypothetical protein